MGSGRVMRWTWVGLGLALIAPGMVAMGSNQLATSPETVAPRAVGLLAFFLLLAVVAWIGRRREGLDWAEMGFGRVHLVRTPLLVLALSGFFVFVFGPLFYAVLAALGDLDLSHTVSELQALPQWYLILAIVIVAGGEEWLYRGYAIERLEAATGRAWLAGGISLVAFAVVHLPLWGSVLRLAR